MNLKFILSERAMADLLHNIPDNASQEDLARRSYFRGFEDAKRLIAEELRESLPEISWAQICESLRLHVLRTGDKEVA